PREGCARANGDGRFRGMVGSEAKPERPIMNLILRAFTCAALATCLSSQPLRAGDAVSGALVISQAWSRATPGGAKVAGGYLTIENRGTAPDRLLSGSTELARRLEIHE